MSFAENLYEVRRNVISKDLLIHLDTEFELVKNLTYLQNGTDPNNIIAHGDSQVTNSFAHYGALCFESLSLQLQPLFEEVTGKKLSPTYTYARIYYPGATMAIHKDRPSCEFSATLCISTDPEPWEIWFETLSGEHKAIFLEPGDLIVYKGDTLNHWRNEYTGKRQTQAFLHYVDRKGNYRDYKYDHRQYIGLPPARQMNGAY